MRQVLSINFNVLINNETYESRSMVNKRIWLQIPHAMEGRGVGENVGTTIGAVEGSAVGSGERRGVGSCEGGAVTLIDGTRDGAGDGGSVGIEVGSGDVMKLGLEVGNGEGAVGATKETWFFLV